MERFIRDIVVVVIIFRIKVIWYDPRIHCGNCVWFALLLGQKYLVSWKNLLAKKAEDTKQKAKAGMLVYTIWSNIGNKKAPIEDIAFLFFFHFPFIIDQLFHNDSKWISWGCKSEIQFIPWIWIEKRSFHDFSVHVLYLFYVNDYQYIYGYPVI